MLKKGTSASPATALASSVLPVPGGPTSSTPEGALAPSLLNFSGLRSSSYAQTSSTCKPALVNTACPTAGKGIPAAIRLYVDNSSCVHSTGCSPRHAALGMRQLCTGESRNRNSKITLACCTGNRVHVTSCPQSPDIQSHSIRRQLRQHGGIQCKGITTHSTSPGCNTCPACTVLAGLKAAAGVLQWDA